MGASLFLHLLVLTVQTSAQYHSEADASILEKMHESSEKHVSDMNGFVIDPELPCGTRCQIKKAMSAWGSLAPMEPQAASRRRRGGSGNTAIPRLCWRQCRRHQRLVACAVRVYRHVPRSCPACFPLSCCCCAPPGAVAARQLGDELHGLVLREKAAAALWSVRLFQTRWFAKTGSGQT